MVSINLVPIIEDGDLPRTWEYQDSNKNTHIYRDHMHPEYAEVIIAENNDDFDVVLEYTDAHILIKEKSNISIGSVNDVATELMENAREYIEEYTS